jgi:stage IV sporulation protein FB
VYALVVLACIIIHEAGHIFFIKSRGVNILSVEITPFGVNIITSGLASYKTDILISLGGPVFNIIAAVINFILLKAIGNSSVLLFAVLTNIIYAVLNLFPVAGLDGGRVLACIVKLKLPENTARNIFSVISAFFLVILSISALFILMLTGYNFTLVLLCAYLFYTIYFKPMSLR